MTNEKIKNKLMALRIRQQLALEETDRLIDEIEKSVPSGEPRERKNLKQGRKIQVENRLIRRGVFDQSTVTNKTLKS